MGIDFEAQRLDSDWASLPVDLQSTFCLLVSNAQSLGNRHVVHVCRPRIGSDLLWLRLDFRWATYQVHLQLDLPPDGSRDWRPDVFVLRNQRTSNIWWVVRTRGRSSLASLPIYPDSLGSIRIALNSSLVCRSSYWKGDKDVAQRETSTKRTWPMIKSKL